VVVAAGSGQRFGGRKQFETVAGRPIVAWSVDAARSVCDGVVLVVPADVASALAGPAAPAHDAHGADAVVAGGATRAASVRAGLAAVPLDADVIVVHDGARPLASPALFRAVVGAVAGGAEGAVPALAVADTVKKVDGTAVVETLARAGLMAVQTPQAFRAATLRRAHADAPDGTDDASVVEAAGATVRVVPGDPRNIKVTTPDDLVVADALARSSAPPAAPTSLRVGHGFDVHRFSGAPGRALVLGGVVVPGAAGLAGHSDADVVSHAVADAVLGAAGLGDLGHHFPDTDDAWAGVDSMDLLARVLVMVHDAGMVVVNADVTVICERPRLAEHTPAMVRRLEQALQAPVSVKAKRAEGLGAVGRVEGIACMAVALLTAGVPS
jgi:2-C-methyl-D-erythritol 4-phosphate cytidylyltransferase / 2-C-methyl-D-erythritol 2,4-cyclodiphosphate synthase